MKKIILLCTVLCAAALYGMEAENMDGLPKDVHREIIRMAFEKSSNLEDTIDAINAADAFKVVRYTNLKDFTKLVHMLAQKFNVQPYEVAQKFETPIAKKYCNLCQVLQNQLLSTQDNAIIKKLLENDADPNCLPMLLFSIMSEKLTAETIELLLTYGADPKFKMEDGKTILEVVESIMRDILERNEKMEAYLHAIGGYEKIKAHPEAAIEYKQIQPSLKLLPEYKKIIELLEEKMKK